MWVQGDPFYFMGGFKKSLESGIRYVWQHGQIRDGVFGGI